MSHLLCSKLYLLSKYCIGWCDQDSNLFPSLPILFDTGLKVNRLDMYGEKYKPFKGVKYVTKAGKFQVRTWEEARIPQDMFVFQVSLQFITIRYQLDGNTYSS